MFSSVFALFSALAGLSQLSSVGAAGTTLPTNLTMTVLLGQNNRSSFECWALLPPLKSSSASGTVGALSYADISNTVNGSYVYFPDEFNAGLHNANAPQYVICLTGGGVISFPKKNLTDPTVESNLYGNYTVKPGSIIIAMDSTATSTLGHETVWQAGTSALQLPFVDGVLPEHVFLHEGPCESQLQ